MKTFLPIFLFVLSTAVQSMANPSSESGPDSEIVSFKVVHNEKEVVWGLDFLDSQRLIFTLQNGEMKILDLKTSKAIDLKNVPEVKHQGQGGLLDVKVSPDFKNDKTIYFTFSGKMPRGATTKLASSQLKGNTLTKTKILFEGTIPNGNTIHFGSRIAIAQDGNLFFSMGDRDERENAQKLSTHQGKILCIKPTGNACTDAPFVDDNSYKKEVWSFGHRNPQGLAFHPEIYDLWEVEFGPRGGDELNLIQKGENYGWPVVSYGREYYGPKIGGNKTHAAAKMVEPVAYWVPSISPSGMDFYTGSEFPDWKNDLFLANLSGEHVRRLKIVKQKVIEQEVLLANLEERWRMVRMGPGGKLWLSTDSGKIGHLTEKLSDTKD